MLILPGLLTQGLVLSLYMCCRGEVCNKSLEIAKRKICPECPEYCPVRELTESCNLYNVAYLFDNNSTVVFALFMSLWATMFMELWKRLWFLLWFLILESCPCVEQGLTLSGGRISRGQWIVGVLTPCISDLYFQLSEMNVS